MYNELLQQASHVVKNNIQILGDLLEEGSKRQGRSTTTTTEYEAFRCGLADTSRHLQFTWNQLELSSKRLQGSSVSYHCRSASGSVMY